MSRSIKHTAIYKQRNDKDFKRLANKRVRRVSIQSGAAFKRVSESYDICDYKWLADKGDKKAVRK
jgi:hypothetical protein